MRFLSRALMLVACVSCNAWSAEWYVSPTGSSSNAGTLASPWNISKGLSAAEVQPGDTVYLIGGVYHNPDRSWSTKYTITLAGTASDPITIRPYQNGRAQIDCGVEDSSGVQHLVIRDLELWVPENLTESRHSPDVSANSYRYLDPERPEGGLHITHASNIKIINCYIHDCMQGVGFWQNATGELYGNVINNNGYSNDNGWHGHGVYTQNAPGTLKSITRNVFGGDYGFSIQAYGSGGALVEDMEFVENVALPGHNNKATRFLIGGLNWASNKRLYAYRNSLFRHELTMSYGGRPVTDSKCIGNVSLMGKVKLTDFVGDNFANREWKEKYASGTYLKELDPSGPSMGPDFDEPYVALHANAYDPDRAQLFVAPFADESSVSVNVADVFSDGDTVEIRDPLDLYGTAVATETVCDGSINVPTPTVFPKVRVAVLMRTNTTRGVKTSNGTLDLIER